MTAYVPIADRFASALKDALENRNVHSSDAPDLAFAPLAAELLRDLGAQPFARTYDGCPMCGGDGGKHGGEWTDATGDIPCRIGALLAAYDAATKTYDRR